MPCVQKSRTTSASHSKTSTTPKHGFKLLKFVLPPLNAGFLALAASAAPPKLPVQPGQSIDESLAFYAELVKETELRRRVNVLFPNPQSLFDGLQVGYVGVRHGNLTFRRRDLVAGTNPLARFARVYDSRFRQGRDFGPGWRLSFDEELTFTREGLVYREGSGARHSFRRTAPGATGSAMQSGQSAWAAGGEDSARGAFPAPGIYTAVPSTPRHESTTVEVAGALAVVHTRGETRLFERGAGNGQTRNTYRLARIVSGDRQILLSYRNGRIETVSDGDGLLFAVTRDSRGRIVSVQDRWGREAMYGYDSTGRLVETRDVAGNTWRYEYGAHGALTRAAGPNGRDILRIRYNSAGRVTESLSGREYSFMYAQGETVVVEGIGHSHVFGHNAAGITDRFESTNGVWWRLALDERNRVTEARSSGGVQEYSYAPNGDMARIDNRSSGDRNTRIFEYDSQGRIASVYSEQGGLTTVDYSGGLTRITGPDTQMAFDALPSGRIAFAGRNETFIGADYNSDGNLIALRSGGHTVDFGRDAMGRLSHVRYAGGEINRYQYDELGNRTAVTVGRGGATSYTHDPSGNIVEVEVTEGDGEEKRQSVDVGDMNRVERITYEGLGKLDIGYDSMGRAVSFDTGRDNLAVEYADPSVIARIVSRTTGAEWSPNNPGSGGCPSRQKDFRLEVIQGESEPMAHPYYAVAGFDEFTLELVVHDLMELGVPGLRAARATLAVAEPLFSGNAVSAMMEFEKPSNPVFQPLEYRSTNCCVCIVVYAQESVGGGSAPPLPENNGPICICSPTPPPPPESELPPYKEPKRPALPEVEFTNNELAGGAAWGETRFNAAPAVYCQTAVGTDKARLEGEINVTQNTIQVTTKIKAPVAGPCKDGFRTSGNINRTADHERRHATAYIQLVNDHLDRLGVEYPNISICIVQAQEFEKDFAADLAAVRQRQHAHKDFCGEPTFGAKCVEGQPNAVEVQSGSYCSGGRN